MRRRQLIEGGRLLAKLLTWPAALGNQEVLRRRFHFLMYRSAPRYIAERLQLAEELVTASRLWDKPDYVRLVLGCTDR